MDLPQFWELSLISEVRPVTEISHKRKAEGLPVQVKSTAMAASVPPSPAVYLPFGMSPRAPLGSVTGLDSFRSVASPDELDEPEDPDDVDDDSSPSAHSLDLCAATPGGGVYVSAEEVMALQLWAEDREAIRDRAAEAEQLATAREAEAAQLRERLAASEQALRAVLRDRNGTTTGVAAGVGAVAKPACAPSKQASVSARSSRTDAEVDALANALATRRRAEGTSRRREEAAALRAELRSLREQQSTR